jgi:TPR repeat protein
MVETALGEAARLLDDRAALMASMQGRAERLGQTLTAQRFGSRRTDAERHAEALRALVQCVSADMAVTQTGTQVVS